MEQDLNWYEDLVEAEADVYRPVDKEIYKVSYYFERILSIFFLAFFLAIGILVVRFFLQMEKFYFLNTDFDVILIGLSIFFGSLYLFSIIARLFIFILKLMNSTVFKKRFEVFYPWAITALWFTMNSYLARKFLKEELKENYKYTQSFLKSGILTSVVFSITSILMQLFYESFVKKSLDAKIRDVSQKEYVLSIMKEFRYKVSESVFTTTENMSFQCDCFDYIRRCCAYKDSLSISVNFGKKDENPANYANIYLPPPVLMSLTEAKNLSKEVFDKVSENGEVLTFDDFSIIFPDLSDAQENFSKFDLNDDGTIDKKEFKDTIIAFYLERLNLEKGFEIAKGFVDIINDIVNVVVMGFLVLCYLILFGISIKDLLAVALSSALVLNFAVSGVAVDMYFNIVVLLSHPFDIGDEVSVDGVDYTVFEIGLNSTSFICKNGGKVKFVNSVLWKKSLINMTRAPEKVILFSVKLNSSFEMSSYRELKVRIHNYLKERPFDYHESFSLEMNAESATNIDVLDCCFILRCKTYKSKPKKFNMRVEFSNFLRRTLKELNIKEV